MIGHNMLTKFLSIITCALIIGGCATPFKPTALDEETRKQLTDVRVYGIIWQDEVIVQAQPSGISVGLGGGLIPALIDSKNAESRQTELQNVIEPFYASTDDIDFRQQFWDEMEPVMTSGQLGIKISSVEKTAILLKKDTLNKEKAQLSPGKGFLHLGVGYRFNRDFTRINLTLGSELFVPNKEKAAFSNIIYYQSAQVGNGGADSIKLWADNNGKRYRDAIREGIRELIKRLKIELTPTSASSDSAEIRTLSVFDAANEGNPVIGPVLDQHNDRLILRHTNGRVFSYRNNLEPE